jgi:hypothetical protein
MNLIWKVALKLMLHSTLMPSDMTMSCSVQVTNSLCFKYTLMPILGSPLSPSVTCLSHYEHLPILQHGFVSSVLISHCITWKFFCMVFSFQNIIGKFLKNDKQGFSNRNHKAYFPTSWMFSVTHFVSLNPLFYPAPHKSMSRRVIMVKSEKIYIMLLLLLLSELNQWVLTEEKWRQN